MFAGGFDFAGAEAVCSGGEVEEFEVVGLLDTLVDKSLVQADETGGTVRYRLLDTIREYGASRLAARGEDELDRVRLAHRDHYLALAEAAESHLRGVDEIEWVDRLDAELDNLRVAFAECLADPDPTPGLRLGVALSEFWVTHGYGIEGAEMLLAHLARPEAQDRRRCGAGPSWRRPIWSGTTSRTTPPPSPERRRASPSPGPTGTTS